MSIETHGRASAAATLTQEPDVLSSIVRPSWWQATIRRVARHIPVPLAIILGIQACLSLSLVWSNTAFGDEALYLWAGRLELANWLHGQPTPVFRTYFSGAPQIYPPLGAIAAGIGGLAAARILSLVFMLGTTILLYAIATQLFDRMSAYIAIGLWSVCEPCLKLGAFATYDPMSVFVICLGAWVAIQAGQRRHHGEFVALAGPILALGSVIGYSYAIYLPIVIAVAGLAWAPWLGRRQAAISAAWLTGAIGVPLLAALTFLKLWPGIFFTVLSRHVTIAQGYKLVVSNAWSWQGIVTCLAIVGVVMAVAQRKHVALACVLAATSLLVPLDQARLQTGVSLDKHLSVGAWFAAMAAGYGVCQIVKAHRPTKALATAGCIVFAIPAVTGVSAAQWTFHGWSNASALTSAFMKYAARVRGNYAIVNLNENVLRFATPEGNHWRRWTGLPSASVVGGSGPRQRMLTAQYEVLLHRHKLGIVVVSFSTPSPTSLAQTAVRGAAGAIRGTLLDQEVLRLISGPGTPGMTAAIEALVTNRNYVPVAVVPYGPDSSCVIWLLRGTSQ